MRNGTNTSFDALKQIDASLLHVVYAEAGKSDGPTVVLAEGEPPPAAWHNTSLTIIDHPPPWRVRLLNCAAHLDDVETRPRPESGAV